MPQKRMPPIYEAIESCVQGFIEQVGRQVLVDAIEEGATTVDRLCCTFEDALRSRLSPAYDEPGSNA